MLAAYVILDGFDIGAGIVHYFVGRNQKERETVISAVGPVWDGNEVWLLATGGTLVLCLSGTLCGRVQRVLPAVDNGALAADIEGGGYRAATSAR